MLTLSKWPPNGNVARELRDNKIDCWVLLSSLSSTAFETGSGRHIDVVYLPECTVEYRDDSRLLTGSRGRSERAFGTHQGRLPQELALHKITAMHTANRYLKEVYMPAYNVEFAVPAAAIGSAFVPWYGGNLADIFCEQYERVGGNDNCVSFDGLSLQIPKDQSRCHYVKTKVKVHRYGDRSLALFHGPRKLAAYTAEGILIKPEAIKINHKIKAKTKKAA